jgi:UDP:flavonoid glycosyltransferase YjiC (YdhE family)
MARALLIPHAPTTGLAHVGACMAVGRHLRERGHEVTMAYGGTRAEVIEREGFRWRAVPEVAPEREWSPGGWFASGAELHSLVEGHLELLDELRPDVAVASSGIAGRMACELRGVPLLHLMHYIQTTSYGRRPIVWGDRLRDARHPRRAARVLRARLGRRGRRQAGTPPTMDVVAAVRAQLGLPPTGAADYGAARDTLVAITSAPFVDPAEGLPAHWRHVGPLAWSAPASDKDAQPRHGDRPLVYVTQGSTGSPELLRRAVSELATGELDLLVATGGLCDPAELAGLGPHVRAAELLPGRACLEAADAAVIHGGHLTFCEALATGTPVVVVPHRSDQTARVNRAERLGVGLAVWPPPLRRGAIARAMRRVLDDPGYTRRSSELAARLEGWDGALNAAGLAESLAISARVA